ncbi:MAG: 16S rRNA (guanine(527)-N(7))-methyltransferase RsmG [Bryobacterales bacterium]|nr:16S rRNA (guanine(527)-N(7))-methyltransferase RsmG [Bryobacterales bacterium]
MLLEELGAECPVSREQAALLESHYQALLRWNKVLNLTRITEVAEAVRRHYCESIFLAFQLPSGPLKVADIGSGGGFPGIPVGLVRPETSVTLVESHQRKAVFLREATRGLPNVNVASVRSEMLPQGSFDWVVSRAVRWADVLGLGVAANAALLMSVADAEGLQAEADGWVVDDIRSLPWNEELVVVKARVVE